MAICSNFRKGKIEWLIYNQVLCKSLFECIHLSAITPIWPSDDFIIINILFVYNLYIAGIFHGKIRRAINSHTHTHRVDNTQAKINLKETSVRTYQWGRIHSFSSYKFCSQPPKIHKKWHDPSVWKEVVTFQFFCRGFHITMYYTNNTFENVLKIEESFQHPS